MAHGSALLKGRDAAADDPVAAAIELARDHRVCETHRDVYAVVLALFHGPRARGTGVSPVSHSSHRQDAHAMLSIETSYTELQFMSERELSDSTVRRAIARLAAVGLITLDDRARPGSLVLAVGPKAYRPDPQRVFEFEEAAESAVGSRQSAVGSTADRLILPTAYCLLPTAPSSPTKEDHDASSTHGVVHPAAAHAAARLGVVDPPEQGGPPVAAAAGESTRGVCAPALAPAPARAPTDGLQVAYLAANADGRSRCKVISRPEAAAAQDFLPMGSIEKKINTLIPHQGPPRAARARDGPHGAEAESFSRVDNADPFRSLVVPAINGLATRTAANSRADKQQLMWMMEQAVADPATHPSRFGLVAEAVQEGRLEREDLETVLGYVRGKRLAGEITKSPGALFLKLMQKRLGDDLKGGAGR